jgi:microcystin-dependent protein
MGTPYIGEIRMFGGNFAPAGWMFCQGQLLSISENDTLFNLIGTTYGGDGQENFALPNLQSRFPIHMGQGAGLPNRVQAETGGAEEVTITPQTLPAHSHGFMVSTSAGTTNNASGNVVGASPNVKLFYEDTPAPAVALNAQVIQPTGGSQPHENIQPFQVINFIISLFGVFPSQS